MQLSVLTLNTWFPPYAQHFLPRARAIAAEIQNLHPDVVCLQEVFLTHPRETIMNMLANDYPFARYFHAGLLGSGLLILSKHPILQAGFHRFELGGKPEDLAHGDYYAGKGIGFVRIRFMDTDVNIFNTHTHAQYEMPSDNEYAFFTASNLWEAANFVKTMSGNYPSILAGDINSRPDQLGYQIIQSIAELYDAFTTCHPNDTGFTYSQANPYVTSPDQRLDYLFYTRHLQPENCDIVFTGLSVEGALAHSDHFGLMATFALQDDSVDITREAPDIRTPFIDLATRELMLTDNQELAHLEAAILVAATGIDTWRQIGHINDYAPWLAKRLRRAVIWLSVLTTMYHLLQILVNLPRRRQAIVAALNSMLR